MGGVNMNGLKRFLLAVTLAFSIGVTASEAGITNFPGGVSSYGVPVLPGIGSNVFSGNVFWVDSGHTQAADGAGGGTKDQPFSTIDFAVGQCTANNSDLIIVMPGHVETVTAAAGLDLDVAGITVFGIGNGSDRPTVRFTTATTADCDIDAANVTVINILFEARIDMLAQAIDINAADARLLNIETRDITSVGSCTNFIVTDANADRLLVDGWRHIGTATAGTQAGTTVSPHPRSAILVVGGDDIIIRNFNLYGAFGMSGIMNTETACTRININGGDGMSYIWTTSSTDSAVALRSDGTGFIGPNIAAMLTDNAANITEAFTASAAQFIGPLPICNLAGEQAATTTNITSSIDE